MVVDTGGGGGRFGLFVLRRTGGLGLIVLRTDEGLMLIVLSTGGGLPCCGEAVDNLSLTMTD